MLQTVYINIWCKYIYIYMYACRLLTTIVFTLSISRGVHLSIFNSWFSSLILSYSMPSLYPSIHPFILPSSSVGVCHHPFVYHCRIGNPTSCGALSLLVRLMHAHPHANTAKPRRVLFHCLLACHTTVMASIVAIFVQPAMLKLWLSFVWTEHFGSRCFQNLQ